MKFLLYFQENDYIDDDSKDIIIDISFDDSSCNTY